MRQAILIGLFLLGLIAAAGSAQAATTYVGTTYVGTSNDFDCSNDDLLQDPGVVWSGNLSGTYFQPELVAAGFNEAQWVGQEPRLRDGSALPKAFLGGTPAVWASVANAPQGVPIGSTWTYTLDTSVNTGGYNLSQVNLFFGDGIENHFAGMAVKVEYSKVGSGTFDVLYDMGYDQFASSGYGKISVGDYNWNDTNNDGIRDANEMEFTGATIATGVDAVRFSWASEYPAWEGPWDAVTNPYPNTSKTSLQNNGTPVYEIDVFGTAVVGTPVPAPAGLALLGLGSMGLAFIRRRKAQKA